MNNAGAAVLIMEEFAVVLVAVLFAVMEN